MPITGAFDLGNGAKGPSLFVKATTIRVETKDKVAHINVNSWFDKSYFDDKKGTISAERYFQVSNGTLVIPVVGAIAVPVDNFSNFFEATFNPEAAADAYLLTLPEFANFSIAE